MSPGARDALIGACAIAATLSVVTLLMLFGEIDMARTWRLTLLAPATNGISGSSQVSLDGVPVGSIQTVELTDEGPWPVRIIADIDEGVAIPQDVTPLSAVSLLTGSAGLYLESPPPPRGPPLPTDGSAVIEGVIQSQAMRDMTRVIDERIAPSIESIERLSTAWGRVGEGLAVLLGPADDSEGPTIASSLSLANDVLVSVSSWVDDPDIRTHVKELLHVTLAGVDRAVTALESFDDLLGTIDVRSADATEAIASSGRALAEALHQVSAMLTRIGSGEGTAGLMLTNPDLYNQLDEAAKQLKRLAESTRLMIEQIREEGVGPLISP